jgi:mRNA interferase MazF
VGVNRGEIWWADLPAPVGRRPVLLLSRNRAYSVRSAVTVAFITTTICGIPVEVALGQADGLSKNCVINLDVINTIPKDRLMNRITALSASKMGAAEAAIRFALELR